MATTMPTTSLQLYQGNLTSSIHHTDTDIHTARPSSPYKFQKTESNLGTKDQATGFKMFYRG